MTNPQTTQTPAPTDDVNGLAALVVALYVAELQAVRVDGCTMCAAAARARKSAVSLESIMSIRAANNTIRQHPHRQANDDRSHSPTMERIRPLLEEQNRWRKLG